MGMGKLKRCLAGFLAVATVLSSSNIAYAAGSIQENKWTATAAEIVAEAYGLSEDEQTILNSGLVDDGKVYTADVPVDADELLKVESGENGGTVYAKEYKSNGLVWVPETAEIMVEGNAVESISLDGEAKDGYDVTGEFDYFGSFSVKVNYQLSVTIDTDEQKRLLDISTTLASGIETLEVLSNVGMNMATLAGFIDELAKMSMVLPKDEMDAVMDLKAECDQNDGSFILTNLADEYDMLEGSVFDFVEKNAEDIKDAAEANHTSLMVLQNSTKIPEDYKSVLTDPIANLETLKDAAWTMDSVLLSNYSYDEDFETAIRKVYANGATEVTDFIETFKVADTAVSKTVNAYSVALVVKVNAVNAENTVAELLTEEGSVVIGAADKDHYKDIVTEAAEKVETDALAAWAEDEEVVDTHFERTVSTLPDELSDGIIYEITYAPKEYKVTSFDGENMLPYGSTVTLPKHTDEEKSYDYTVNGDFYDQGAEILVNGELTITREEGPKKVEESLLGLIAVNDQYELDAASREILASPALNGLTVKIRYPENTVVSKVAFDNGTYSITASSYPSGVAGMVWEPVKAVLMNGEEEVKKVDLVENQRTRAISSEAKSYYAEWTEDNFTNVTVKYSLKLTKVSNGTAYEDLTSGMIMYGLKLPEYLVGNVQADQDMLNGKEGVTAEKVFNTMKAEGDELEDPAKATCFINSTILGLMADKLEGPAAKTAMAEIRANEKNGGGWNAQDKELAIFSYLRKAAAADWSVAAYYQNKYYDGIKTQAEFLAPRLEEILADTGFNAFLKEAVDTNLITQEYADKLTENIEELIGQFEIFKMANAPHESLNVEHPEFAVLIGKLLAANVEPYAGPVAETLNLNKEIKQNAPKIASVTVSVKVGSGLTQTATFEYEKPEGSSEYVLSDKQVADIEKKIAELVAAGGITADNKKYFESVEYTIPTVLTGDHPVDITYVPKTYTVTLDGEEFATFQYGGEYGISLEPYSKDAASNVYYQYTIGSDVRKVDNGETKGYYKFASLDVFDENDSFAISRKKIDKTVEEIDAFVDSLNAGLESVDGVAFVPLKSESEIADNGKYDSIVLQIAAKADLDFKGIMTAIANAFMEMKYDYIGFGDVNEGVSEISFKYLDEEGKMWLNPQAIIDMFLSGGPTSASILNMLNEDGSIKNNVPGTTEKLGGVFVDTNIHLGDNTAVFENIPMYVTLTDGDTAYMKQVRTFLEKISAYVTLDMSNGAVSTTGTMPEKLYNVYLTLMVLLGNISLDDFNEDVNLRNHIEDLLDIVGPVITKKETTWKTVEDVLNNQIGYKCDLSAYSAVITKILTMLKSLYGVDGSAQLPTLENETDNAFAFTVSYDASSVLDRVNGLELIRDMLATTVFSVPFEFKVLNIKEEYEALVIDMGQSGLDKLSYTDDLEKTLAEAKGTTYVVLLDNIDKAAKDEPEKVLTVKKNTVLNLNGKYIYCDVKAEDALRIVDSTLDSTVGVGGVFGKLEGNVRAAAGYYKNLDPAMLHETCTMTEAGYVYNKYFSIAEEDGNLTVELTTEFAEALEGNVQMLALELASDLLFEIYTYASVAVDGNQIYDMEMGELLNNYNDIHQIASDAIETVDEDGLTWLLNTLVDKFSDFEGLAETIMSEDGVIASFDLTTAPWAVRANISEDNKITAGILSGDETTRNLTFKFKEQNEALANSFFELGNIVNVEKTIDLVNVSYDKENGFDIQGVADVEVIVDLLGEEGTASDYVSALAVVLAYNMEDGDAKKEFIQAIENYENNVYGGDVRQRIDALSIQDVVDACEAAKDVEFETMLEELGLRNLLFDSNEIELCYRPLLKVVYIFADEINAVVGDKARVQEIFKNTLGGVKNPETGHYDVEAKVTETAKFFGELRLFSKLTEKPEDSEDKYYNDAAQRFIDLVNAIPGITEENRTAYVEYVADARAAYDALTDEQKALKDIQECYRTLLEIEKMYDAFGIWVADIENQTYTGKAIKPEVKVYDGAKRLTIKKDYTVSYKYNTNAADAEESGTKTPTVTVTLKKNYKGKIYAYFTIEKINLSGTAEYLEEVGVVVNGVDRTASKKAVYGKPVLMLNGKKISAAEYTLSYPSADVVDANGNVIKKAYADAGSYVITLTAKDKNFTGSISTEQRVATALMSKTKTAKIPSQELTAEGAVTLDENELVVRYGKVDLVRGVHYEVLEDSYKNNDKVGTASVVIEGKGFEHADEDGLCFVGTKTIKFKVVKTRTLTSKMITMNTKSVPYTGKAIELENGKDFVVEGLTEWNDYTVTYKKNDKAGTATVTFTGVNGCTGKVSKSFKIDKVALEESMVVSKKDNITVEYQKGGVKPASDFILKYNGMKLVNGKDYTMKWKNVTKVADASIGKKAPTVEIVGKGNYTGKLPFNFTIVPADFDGVTIEAKDVVYKDKPNNFKTTVTVKDVNGKKLANKTDYTVSYEVNGVPVGRKVVMPENAVFVDVTAKVTGNGNYANAEATTTYRLYNTSLSKATIKVSNFTYDKYSDDLKDKIEENITVTLKGFVDPLKKGVDYEIKEIKNYAIVGAAKVTIEGKGMFGGTKAKTFKITARPKDPVVLEASMLGDDVNVANFATVTLQKGGAKPEFELNYKDSTGKDIVLKEGRDYTIKWSNFKKAASADAKKAPMFKITGKGNFKGTLTVKYTIVE